MSYPITSTQSLTEMTTPEDDDVIPISEVSVTARATDGVILNTALGRLTSASAPFVSTDTGKFVTIPGAGASGADHVAQVRYISTTTVALTPPALTAVASADFFFAVTKKIKFSTLKEQIADSSGIFYFDFAYGDSSPKSLLTVIAGRRVVSAQIQITQAFNGAGASLKIGDSSNTESVMASSDVDPTSTGTYETRPAASWGSNTSLRLTITPGSGTSTGSGVVVLQVES